MKSQQKALLVTTSGDATRGLDELNRLLGRGWRVAAATALGGGAGLLGALVVVERADDREAAALVEEAEESVEELLAETGPAGDGGLTEPELGEEDDDQR